MAKAGKYRRNKEGRSEFSAPFIQLDSWSVSGNLAKNSKKTKRQAYNQS